MLIKDYQTTIVGWGNYHQLYRNLAMALKQDSRCTVILPIYNVKISLHIDYENFVYMQTYRNSFCIAVLKFKNRLLRESIISNIKSITKFSSISEQKYVLKELESMNYDCAC